MQYNSNQDQEGRRFMSAAARAEARFVKPPNRPAIWARQAVGTFVAAQKILLDLTAQQNALVIGLVRERVRMPKVQPGRALAKATRKGVKGTSSVGKLLLDLTSSESAILAETVKEGLRLSHASSALTDIFSHRVDTMLEMLKRLLDSAASQILGALDSYLEGHGLKFESGVVDMLRQSIVGFVEVEKKFLDLVAEEVTEAVEASRNGRKSSRERTRTMTKLARQAVEEFIGTQKKLLDLALQEFGESEAEVEPPEPVKEEKHTSFAELTQRSVQNLVLAQKSLLDLAVKPAHGRPVAASKPPVKAVKATKAAKSSGRAVRKTRVA